MKLFPIKKGEKKKEDSETCTSYWGMQCLCKSNWLTLTSSSGLSAIEPSELLHDFYFLVLWRFLSPIGDVFCNFIWIGFSRILYHFISSMKVFSIKRGKKVIPKPVHHIWELQHIYYLVK